MAPSPENPDLRWSVEEIEATPSRGDGVLERDERVERFLACEYARNLIRQVFNNDRQQEDNCNRVQILACYYLQLFFMFQSLRKEDAKTVAVAGTFLACKVVDLPRKMRGILRALNQLRVQGNVAELGEDEQKRLCDRVLKIESALLRIIRFDFDLSLPLEPLAGLTEALLVQLTCCRVFIAACRGQPQQEAQALRQELLRVAERFVLDSFMGFAPLLAHPRVVAAGALAIATKYMRREMNSAELCRLLAAADATLVETDVKRVVDEILNVFRSKHHAGAAGGAAAAQPAS